MDASTKAEVNELIEKLTGILAQPRRADGSTKTFDEMELEANAFGDQISAKLLQCSIEKEKCQQISSSDQGCRCPRCNSPGLHCEEPEAKLVQALRGEVQWLEDEYFCRKCRKSFFPYER